MIRLLKLGFVLTIFLTACSVVKSPQANNFQRVKYNAHLKLAKKQDLKELATTVSSFPKEEKTLEKSQLSAARKENLEAIHKDPVILTEMKKKERLAIRNSIKERFLKTVDQEQFRPESDKSLSSTMDWWEDDPEDWPWQEIVLAAIAVLLIVLIVVLVIDLIGGLLGALLGVILLLLLAYFLIEYWY